MLLETRYSFTRIKLILVTGKAGGAPYTSEGSEISLGDVLVSTQVIHYDFSRTYTSGIKAEEGLSDTHGRPGPKIANALTYLQRGKRGHWLTRRMNEYIEEDCLAYF